jgi:hypothetical protein
MSRRASRKEDRLIILDIAKILGVSKRRIKKDGCGDWIIEARRGYVATDGSSIYLYVRSGSSRRWKAAKRSLQFLSARQDGDDEGIFCVQHWLTVEETAAIRKVLGLRKAPVLTDEQRSSRCLNLAPKKRAVSSGIVDSRKSPLSSFQKRPEPQENEPTKAVFADLKDEKN